MCNVTLQKFRSGGSSALQGVLGARYLLVVCMVPLWLGGLRWNKSTPSVGWEVQVKSLRSVSMSCMERAGQRFKEGDLGYGILLFYPHGRLLFTLHFHFCTFIWVNKMFDLQY
jgi:hypothetical protein